MPKLVDSEQYRKELLHKCFDLLANKGYANVTTRQIALELGISTGSLYHYFPSKKALFEQLVEEINRQDLAMLKAATYGAQTLSDRLEAFGAFLIKHQDYFMKQAIIWVDFYRHQDGQEAPDNPVFQQIDDQYLQAIMTCLDLGDPKLARFVYTLINGLLLDRLDQVNNQNSLTFAEQIDLLIKMLTAYFEKYGTAEVKN